MVKFYNILQIVFIGFIQPQVSHSNYLQLTDWLYWKGDFWLARLLVDGHDQDRITVTLDRLIIHLWLVKINDNNE